MVTSVKRTNKFTQKESYGKRFVQSDFLILKRPVSS